MPESIMRDAAISKLNAENAANAEKIYNEAVRQ